MDTYAAINQLTLILAPSRVKVTPLDAPGFMDMPTEIRLLIYEELLIVGKVFYKPRRYEVNSGCRFIDHKKYRKPPLQIFCVSKQVHQEAEEVYLSG
jgi:hypothetical protein